MKSKITTSVRLSGSGHENLKINFKRLSKKLFIFPILFLFFSCQVEGDLTHTVQNSVPITPTAVLKYHGIFVPTSGITVSGEAKIYLEGNLYRVQLEDFSISNGPDLKVYLSKSAEPIDFVNLGNLTSQTVYPIPESVNVAEYSHVLIHCQQYDHLYAIAELIQN
ncbi:MAG: DM13 domain-containing protein [Flavobacterium sp.]|uniref:DM13 domain-containing protein n=1 Tax=Flavobacterium sp. TaxID=239 RepID=UPI003263FA0D